jgi:peptide-methionine (S)-S-oxide reductase
MSLFSLFDKSQKLVMPDPDKALKGRANPIPTAERHYVNGNPLKPPYPAGYAMAMFGMGCFWGAERKFWQNADVYITAVGYSAGFTPNPTYEEVCSGLTGHSEVVLVVYDPAKVKYEQLLKIFWENHDPTQGMRQGNDIGTQYRSGIYFYTEEQQKLAEKSKELYQAVLTKAGYGKITTEILPAKEFYFAEAYHQQYLAKNPNGYCGLGGCKVPLPEIV